jgi:glycosyltransferase involved in cell wall biosynthesis
MNHEKFPDQYDPNWLEPIRKQYRNYLMQAHRIIAISHSTKQDVIKYYGIDPDLIDVVHLGVDPSRFSPTKDPASLLQSQLNCGNFLPYLLFVGERGGYKNFSRLLDAFRLSDFHLRGVLIVAGKPLKEHEQEKIAFLGLTDHVRVIVGPKAEELCALYRCAEGFVYPSLGEGFGIPVLEAMACGTPALLSDIPVFHEVAGDAALYFDPLDCEDMARCLDSTLSQDLRKQFTEKGLRNVTKFSWDACAANTLSTYRRVLHESQSGTRSSNAFTSHSKRSFPIV